MAYREIDFLVIGSGIAGLSYALKVAEHGKVCIITKDKAIEGSTKYAQGGIAAVMYDPDTYEKHIADTIDAGDDLSDPEIVRITITESTDRVKELIALGTEFDKNESGKYDLTKEGGHSENRVLHYKDKTGLEIEETLLKNVRKHPNIELIEHHFVVDLITQHHLGEKITRGRTDIQCYGAYALDEKTSEIKTFLSRFTMIATGGAGSIYTNTTNPVVATGDGVAMVYRAKGLIDKMEFFQFHPTSLYNPTQRPSFLITEAMRGEGAVLKTAAGKEFMHQYDERGSLAPRDIVARAIDSEMKISGSDFVYLDATHIDDKEIEHHFPTILEKCLSIGIDIRTDMIPVVPATHYMCGGIKVDQQSRSSIANLFASGECSSTGLHGANRLASNSLLEALVFSHRAANESVLKMKEVEIKKDIPEWNSEGMELTEEMVLITQTQKELQLIMSNYVGIVRSNLRLKRALHRLEIIFKETEQLYWKSILNVELCELRNMINVAYLVIKMAQARKESRGLHYSIDYPRENT